MNKGNYPDAACLISAIRAAINNKQASIISCEARPWLLWCLCVLNGALLAGLFVVYGLSNTWAVYAFVCSVLFLLAYIDSATYILPDALTQPLLWCGVAYAWYGYGIGLNNSLLGVAAGYFIPVTLSYIWLRLRGHKGMGAGDAKLLAAVGSWVGGSLLLPVMLVASLANVVFAVLHQRSLRPGGAYPFGPFVFIGATTILLFA